MFSNRTALVLVAGAALLIGVGAMVALYPGLRGPSSTPEAPSSTEPAPSAAPSTAAPPGGRDGAPRGVETPPPAPTSCARTPPGLSPASKAPFVWWIEQAGTTIAPAKHELTLQRAPFTFCFRFAAGDPARVSILASYSPRSLRQAVAGWPLQAIESMCRGSYWDDSSAARHPYENLYVGENPSNWTEASGLICRVDEGLRLCHRTVAYLFEGAYGRACPVADNRATTIHLLLRGSQSGCQREDKVVELVPFGGDWATVSLVPGDGAAAAADASQCAFDTGCGPGTHFEQGRGCVDCAAGTHVEHERGCVANAAPAGPGQRAMVTIAGGTFQMGSPASGRRKDLPVHPVAVASFEIDATEVTVDDYRACVAEGRCPEPCSCAGCARRPLPTPCRACNWGRPGRGNHPINCVDWNAAATYCTWANKRLPTEEEWEFAAGGDEGRAYPWGDDPPSKQLCWARGSQGTCEVGSSASGDTPTGLHDMAGNVWEWTSSGHSEDYEAARDTQKRVLRGGGWSSDDERTVRSTWRNGQRPSFAEPMAGFRCAR